MDCPGCGERATKVVDSRKRDGAIYRRRACKCGTRFSTNETVVARSVVGPDNELERLIREQERDMKFNGRLTHEVRSGSRRSVNARGGWEEC